MSATKEFNHDAIEREQRRAIADTRDYPILFDTEMVQAILAGNKTQTRRLFKSPLLKAMEPAHEIWHDGAEWIARLKNGQCYKYPIVCPYGEPGDYLWVKETFAQYYFDNLKHGYKADWNSTIAEYITEPIWTPSIHMPKSAARIWLQITNIKAQRILTVSEEEARLEGTEPGKIHGFGEIGQSNFREGFVAKWISIYGIEKYYENPWVWTITFNVVESKPFIIV